MKNCFDLNVRKIITTFKYLSLSQLLEHKKIKKTVFQEIKIQYTYDKKLEINKLEYVDKIDDFIVDIINLKQLLYHSIV